MDVVIIGAGASGVVAAINRKRNYPNDNILIIEHLDKPLKKILATGNGKCNLGNNKIDYSLFNNSELAKSVISDYDYKKFFESLSIKTKLIGDLAYPVSESAVSIREAMLKEINRLGIKINVEEQFIDYICDDKITVITDKNKYIVDELILAGGLKSSPKLGSDGSVIDILSKHNYKISLLNPGLCPITTKEKTKLIDGIRCKAIVTIKNGSSIVHKESGELLFKDHGLSGIVIFNSMNYLARIPSKYAGITVDILPDYTFDELKKYYEINGFDNFLLAFVNPKIAEYLTSRFPNHLDVIYACKNLNFTYDKPYGYEFSQVTVGGIDPNQIDAKFYSKLENNVKIIGELIDIDGPCGGYNLSWAFASAIKATN